MSRRNLTVSDKLETGTITNHGGRKEVTFFSLRSRFKEPEMIYAPFSWIIAEKRITKRDSDTLNLLVSESLKQRSNPGYLFSMPKDQKKEAFLSPEYLDVFGSALEKAEAAGSYFSYVDEWTWPSGQAGGNVLDKYPEMRAQSLYYEVSEVPWELVHLEESFFTVAAEVDDSGKIKSSTLKIISQGPAVDWKFPDRRLRRIYRFTKRPDYKDSIHGQSCVNYLDKRLPERFLELAHQPYEQRFHKHFGKTIPGFFMDHEGDYGHSLAWSDDLEREYREKKGRDIRLWMPLLIQKDTDEELCPSKWAKARWDWYDVVSDLYAKNFFSKVNEWAGERGMYLTAHFYEENLLTQAVWIGSLFRLLRSVSLPGVDCLVDLGLWVRFFKEAQSVSEFEGRRFMGEPFGGSNWDLSPVLMKKVANSMTSWGISHVIPACNLIDRDLRNAGSADLYGMPFFRYLHYWNDFIRRTSYINSHGHTVPDVLVIYPIDSVWAAAGGQIFNSNVYKGTGDMLGNWTEHKAVPDTKGIKQTDNAEYLGLVEVAYTELMRDLDALNIEFLIADTEYIQKMKIGDEAKLRMGNFEFKAVILPPSLILPSCIAEKLLSFARKGGEVYIMGKPPAGSTEQGITDLNMKNMMDKLLTFPNVVQVESSIFRYCKKGSCLEPKIEFLSGDFSILLQHRSIAGRDFYWLANNTDQTQVSQIKFRDAKGGASIWNCETGNITPVESTKSDQGSVLSLKFAPYEGYWLVFDPGTKEVFSTPIANFQTTPLLVPMNPTWKIYIDTADQPPKPYPEFTPVIPKELLLQNGGIKNNLKLWSEWNLTEFCGFVTYENTFTLSEKFQSLILSLGKASHSVEVVLNNKPVGARIWPPFIFDISELAQKGENKIKVIVGNLLCGCPPNDCSLIKQRTIKEEDSNAGLLGPVQIYFYPV